ncbi:gamma-glutamylcyclotransferase [Halobacillus naozhouensis]|uniref:Gamma-glutamylcyclotransferase n=1 Tax=Halobacillus naozhouensis TaxID=554880 RepID=A0ABY8IWI5_9BACI|nr:gamma-glutamylcyclotransferase [Halobacillus naozhouensis]WFT73026.1 gamma-glutamylcyclotransferase [Halobacillus naozhouensis]
MHLFVYGSFCKGEKDHDWLADSSLLFEQARINATLFKSHDNNAYVKLTQTGTVYGELYEVSDHIMRNIDEHNNRETAALFDRKQVTVHTDHENYEAVVYEGVSGMEGEQVLPHGDWKLARYPHADDMFYFAYGSCMDLERFKLAGVESLFEDVVGRASLANYRLRFSHHVHDGGRADIEEHHSTFVEGVLYKITPSAVDYLYDREGVYEGHYRPTIVEVTSHGSTYRALTFTVINKREDKVPPFHYAKEIYRGAFPYVSRRYRCQLRELFTTSFSVQGMPAYMEELEIDR